MRIAAQLKQSGLGVFHAGRELTASETQAFGLAPFGLEPGTKVFLLSEIGSTANVFRVQPPKGKSYVLKVYRSRDANESADTRGDNLRRDREYLEKFAAASKHGPTETLEVLPIEASHDDKHALRLQDFQGHTVSKVLEQLFGSGQPYDKLIAEYNRRVGVFVADCRAAGIDVREGKPDPEHEDIKTYYLMKDGYRYDVGNIHNVLFDPKTGRFMLFDPF